MPKIVIRYRKERTLKALRDFAKYFDYVITSATSDKMAEINGVTLIKGDYKIDDTILSKIFSRKNINPKSLRKSGWK